MNGHRRAACFDYQRGLREGIIHYTDGDTRAKMGPVGGGGPVIPLPEISRLWQKTWVNSSRQRTESQGTVPTTSGDRIVEVDNGTTGEVRAMMLEYTPTEAPAISRGGP